MTFDIDKLEKLVKKKSVSRVQETVFALVRVYCNFYDLSIEVFVDYSTYYLCVPEVHAGNVKSGAAAVMGVRGEGKTFDAAIRDLAIRWGRFIVANNNKREAALEKTLEDLERWDSSDAHE